MQLQDLISASGLGDTLDIQGDLDGVSITDITLDSRLVTPGNLFIALKGTQTDGAAFAAKAVQMGAVAVLAATDAVLGDVGPTSGRGRDDGGNGSDDGKAVVLLRHARPDYALSQISAAFFSAQPETRVAVTGTNGKTSVVNFLRQMWQSSGKNAASIGTLGVIPRGLASIPELTSPDAVTLHRALSALTNAGINCVAMEASSHGLDQHRLHGVRFAAAGFTNFSQDHLDYHSDMTAYLKAKARLFHELNDGPVVLNMDHTPAALVDQLGDKSIIRVGQGLDSGFDVGFHAQPTTHGLSLSLRLPAAGFNGTVKMVGLYQAENIAMAAGLALVSGLPSDSIVEAVANLSPAPGRMDWAASHPSGGPVIVDYAHTPDALVAAIKATRPHVSGRMIVVFGAGGDRDPGKRAPMGAVVARDADIAIVTDDNPRTEDAASIRRAILTACPGGLEIADRRAAITRALELMQPGDGVLIAGKGHEQGQKVGDQTHPFDDAQVARMTASQLAANFQ